MIESIFIEDFKSYANAELKLAPLTVLIGANASGKSNALEAIRFLSWMAQGHQLPELQFMVNTEDHFLRGTTQDIFRFDRNDFIITCQTDAERFNVLKINVEGREKGRLHIGYEAIFELTDEGEPYYLYQTKGGSDGIRTGIKVEYNNFARGGKKPQLPATDQKAIFLQLDSPARFAAGHEKAIDTIPSVTKAFAEQLASIIFLDPNPVKIRDAGYNFLSDQQLKDNGSNLSAILYHIWHGDEGSRQQLLDFISSLPEQKVVGLGFLTGPRSEVMVQLLETFGGKQRAVNVTLLSDGTLRVLAFAAALLSAPEGSMVIIEEIDNGVHPSRARLLLEGIEQIAKERKLSILISSHNPALLDELSPEAVTNTVFCYREEVSGNSQLVRVKDLPHYPDLIMQGSLGDLLTRGLIDRFVKQAPNPTERKQDALKWLASIK